MKDSSLHNRLRWLGVVVFLPLLVAFMLLAGQFQAASATPLTETDPQKPDNTACLACHGQPGQTFQLPSGEVLGTTMDPKLFDASVHNKFSCQTCHVNISGYPHPKNTAQNIKEFRNQFKDTCANCHKDQAGDLLDSAHTLLNKQGNPNTPTCVDCHNPHTQVTIKKDANGDPTFEENATIAKTCATCHNAIYDQYIKSVHGAGVLAKNPDVPACGGCHGIHKISNARSAEFRLKSPELCSKCHTDEKIMGKYNISTQVLTTYVADFHGTTVTLFQKQAPDQETNKPVCFDCHGVHNIAAVDDPQKGLALKQNILVACQKCHPDASTNFPESWLSHYIPSPDKAPLVYYVNLFYMIFIPLILGGMAVVVLTDIYRRIRSRGKPAHTQS